MCIIQTSRIFTNTQSLFVYKVVNKLRDMYHSCVDVNARIPQKHNISFYTPDEWTKIYDDINWNNLGTHQQYIINNEKTSDFPGFYCFNTNKDALKYIKEFKYLDNPTVLICLVPEGTQMFNGEVKFWPGSDPIPSINVFKLIPIRELVA